MRVYETLLRGPSDEEPVPNVSQAITVRALNGEDYPVRGQLKRLSDCAYFLAFHFAWAEAVRRGLPVAAQFSVMARSLRVRFRVIADQDDTERAKWTLAEEALATAENSRLVGIRRAVGIVAVLASALPWASYRPCINASPATVKPRLVCIPCSARLLPSLGP